MSHNIDDFCPGNSSQRDYVSDLIFAPETVKSENTEKFYFSDRFWGV